MTTPSAHTVARYLAKRDPVLGRLIRRVGVRPIPSQGGGFPALVRSIVYQQISGAAGRSITARLVRAAGGRSLPSPEWFRTASDETLRKAGLSPQKIGYLRDLAGRTIEGKLPFRRLRSLSDAEVTELLTAVRGIGEWTAQMYLIFSLGRPDVLPTADLGVRKGVQRVYGFGVLPRPRTIERLARRWEPYRSHGTHYMWRSLELELPVARVSS
jgi:DNA-3-methyladenine glycosylase II